MVFFKSFVSVILIIICCHIYGQEKASQRFSCFKYAIVEPFISNHNPLDNYGIGKKSIIALESIGMKCLDKEDISDWPNDALTEPCKIIFITFEVGTPPNIWNCGAIKIIAKDCKDSIVFCDNIRSKQAVCEAPFDCCYLKWASAAENFFRRLEYRYTPEYNNLKTEYPVVEFTNESEDALKDYFLNSNDPVEGIYISRHDINLRNFKIALKKKNGRYIAIVLQSDYEHWKPGEIKGYFEPTAVKSKFTTTWLLADKTRIETFADLRNEGSLFIELVDSDKREMSYNQYIKIYPPFNDLNGDNFNNAMYPDSVSINAVEIISDVDINIPIDALVNENTFAVIIGNEIYNNEVQVSYALNDARVFKKYLTNTLGLPETNIHKIENATYGQILGELNWIKNVIKAYNGQAKVIFYYAGHGMPDEQSKSAYILPVDGNSTNTLTAIKLQNVYEYLTAFPTVSVIVLLDACFSGAARDRSETMLAPGRAVKVRPNDDYLSGNIVVLSATSGLETAFPFNEKQHGLFTYYLLKKLQESNGNANLKELTNYIVTNVMQSSIVVNSKSQTPQINISPNLNEKWEELRLK